MVVFKRLFRIFGKNDPHKELSEVYSELNEISLELHRILSETRELHKELVEKSKESQKRFTGEVGFKKTEFIEHLLKRLSLLSTDAEKRFWHAESVAAKDQPVDEDERLEIQKILEILRTITKMTKRQYALIRGKKNQITLDEIYELEKEIAEEFKRIHLAREKEFSYARKLVENKIHPLIRKVYRNSRILSKEHPMLVYEMTVPELRLVEKEAQKINRCKDERFRVEFRRWWNEIQVPEKDKATTLKDPHIHVTIKLNGPKKEIHLLLKAA